MPLDTATLMKQVAGLRLVSKRRVDEQLSGAYHSTFKGQGIEFEEVRAYVPGDDVRGIDWNVTARAGQPFVKRFTEERELTVLFLVDVSGSQVFGSASRPKSEAAAELTCLLALSAIRNQDKIGLVMFSDRIVKYLPPRKGRTAVMRLVREVLAADETRHGTNLAEALRFLTRVRKRKAVVFLISDFLDSGFERELRITARRHDLIACPVIDPLEAELPRAGLLLLEDPETGARELVDASSKRLRREFAARSREQRAELDRLLRGAGIDRIDLSTERPCTDAVHRLFRQRLLRRRGV